MKNITLALDEVVLAKARRRAAEKGTTLNAMVRDHLTRIANEDDEIARARKALFGLAENSEARLGPDYQFNREALHDRAELRRHQRADLRGGGQD
jgi:hypothetical protein